MRWGDLRLGLRLGIGFGLVTLLAAVTAIVGLQGLDRLRGAADQLATARSMTEAGRHWMVLRDGAMVAGYLADPADAQATLTAGVRDLLSQSA